MLGVFQAFVTVLRRRVSFAASVTHNLQQAARVSDFAGFMYLGEFVEFGSVRDIFVSPKQRQTERFITGRFG